MKILSGKEAADYLEDLIHPDTQISENGVDLTVKSIYELRGCGSIDFGGSERKDADVSEIEPEFRNPDDDYGWWRLEAGTYLIEYNEELECNKISFLQPLRRLNRNGSSHPSKFVDNLELVPLFVVADGIGIKENSRISRLLIFES